MSTQTTDSQQSEFDLSANPESKKTDSSKRKKGPGGRDADSIPLPAQVNQKRVYMSYLITFIVFHALTMLVFVPWFFSWTGVVPTFLEPWEFRSLTIDC